MKRALKILAVITVFLIIFLLVQRLLEPKYATELVEGSMLSQYYREYGGHEVIFIGDCEVYSNYSPLEMYKEKGITAYIRGSSQQLIWQSYYILRETLRYETPKVIVYNVNAMRYDEPVSEAYNRLTIDRMRWSREKIDIIKASMTEEETFMSYVFPILRYHSRFDELTGEDLEYMFRTKDNTFEGYLLNQNVKPVGTLPVKKKLPDYQFSDKCYMYLDMMKDLCKEKGVELVLVKAPSLYPYWYEEYDEQMKVYAEKNGLRYYNLTERIDEIGLDFQKDTYDAGIHLNLSGARKLSSYFAELLSQEFELTDYRTVDEVNKGYIEKIDEYEKIIKENEEAMK